MAENDNVDSRTPTADDKRITGGKVPTSDLLIKYGSTKRSNTMKKEPAKPKLKPSAVEAMITDVDALFDEAQATSANSEVEKPKHLATKRVGGSGEQRTLESERAKRASAFRERSAKPTARAPKPESDDEPEPQPESVRKQKPKLNPESGYKSAPDGPEQEPGASPSSAAEINGDAVEVDLDVDELGDGSETSSTGGVVEIEVEVELEAALEVDSDDVVSLESKTNAGDDAEGTSAFDGLGDTSASPQDKFVGASSARPEAAPNQREANTNRALQQTLLRPRRARLLDEAEAPAPGPANPVEARAAKELGSATVVAVAVMVSCVVIMLAVQLLISSLQGRDLELQGTRQVMDGIRLAESDSAATRTGAIYLLEDGYERCSSCRTAILKTVEAVLHERASVYAISFREDPRPPPDVRAGLEFLVARSTSSTSVDLSDLDLRGADLRDANLQGWDLHGSDLSGANLSGTDLRGAKLEGCRLDDVVVSDTTEGLSQTRDTRTNG